MEKDVEFKQQMWEAYQMGIISNGMEVVEEDRVDFDKWFSENY